MPTPVQRLPRRAGFRNLAALALAALLPLAAHAAETLRVLSWPGYADPDIIKAFEKRHRVTVQVTVRNFRSAPQKHHVVLKLPPGVTAEPPVLEGSVAAKSRQSFPVKLTVKDRTAMPLGVQLVPFDIALDGKRYGELFDFLILANPTAP